MTDILQKYKIDYAPYEEVYKDLHRNPGLSNNEEYAAKHAADYLQKLGYTVLTKIGGHGVVGVLENGPGKVVLGRADMDALPVKEDSGLEYASTKVVKDEEGYDRPVMHACGHDMHVTTMMAAAETMANSKGDWKGTFIALFQPAEEPGTGADAMINDGLYDKIPTPDVVLSQHVMPAPAGTIFTPHNVALMTADSLLITIYGKGAHSSQPNAAVNAALIASHAAIRIANIKGTEMSGAEFGVVSVTAIESGHAPNVIPGEARVKVNIRTKSEETRDQILSAIKRIVRAECMASLSPKEPEFENIVHMPLLENDEDTTNTVEAAFKAHFKDGHCDKRLEVSASEDAGVLASTINKPICYWFTGSVSKEVFEKSNGKPPFNHSSDFAPVIQPTLTVGHESMVVGAIAMLNPSSKPSSIKK